MKMSILDVNDPSIISRGYQQLHGEGTGNIVFFDEDLSPEQLKKAREWCTSQKPLADRWSIANDTKPKYVNDAGILPIGNKIMIVGEGETIHTMDCWSLRPEQEVRDTIIHYAMKSFTTVGLLDDNVALIPSLFLTKVYNEGHDDLTVEGSCNLEQMKRWSKKIIKTKNISEMKTIVFFRNLFNFHWRCYVICIDNKTIQVFDSLGPMKKGEEGPIVLKDLYQWLSNQYLEIGMELKPSEWHLYPATKTDCPQQPNGYDCGLYMLLIGICVARRQPLSLVTRKRIATARPLLILHFLEKESENDSPTRSVMDLTTPPRSKRRLSDNSLSILYVSDANNAGSIPRVLRLGQERVSMSDVTQGGTNQVLNYGLGADTRVRSPLPAVDEGDTRLRPPTPEVMANIALPYTHLLTLEPAR